jgi:hypothetical protein
LFSATLNDCKSIPSNFTDIHAVVFFNVPYTFTLAFPFTTAVPSKFNGLVATSFQAV